MVISSWLLSAALAAPPGGAGPTTSLLVAQEANRCLPTPPQDLLPDVVGPMVGTRPAWRVGGGDRWTNGAHPVKTLWVFARTSLDVRIEGRRLDGPGALTFQRQPDPVTEVLVITDPGRTSVIPGGAPSEVMRAYSFIPSYVFYPSPGCWEFTVRIGDDEVRIVYEMKPAQ